MRGVDCFLVADFGAQLVDEPLFETGVLLGGAQAEETSRHPEWQEPNFCAVLPSRIEHSSPRSELHCEVSVHFLAP